MGEVYRRKTLVSDNRRACRVALNLVLANKRRLATEVMARYSEPAEALDAGAEEWSEMGVSPETARRLFPKDLRERGLKEVEAAEKRGITLLTVDDESYPPLLREIFDPPPVLYCLGRTDVLREPCLAVVGARKPTPYGRAMAESLSREAARSGLVVVSGLAFGIDTQAHWGALAVGRTIAVLGSGLDIIYPASNRSLAKKIAEQGAVISEFPLGFRPLGFHFPLRNRIISGLSLAVVVVEASLRSGSLITARLALEQNRDVMAVPGNATSALSAGTNWLIQNGAKLVGRWEDIVEELPAYVRDRLAAPERDASGNTPDLTPDETKVLAVLKPDTLMSVDELAEATDYSVSELLSILLMLELKAAVLQGPGKRYLRRN
jgi:DNA processing protein